MGREEIVKVYKELMHMRWKRLAICLLILAGCVLLFSIPLGIKWMFEDVFLFAIVCVFASIMAFFWEVKTIVKHFKPLQDILFQECDPAKLLEVTKQGVAYGLEDAKNQKSSAFLQFEAEYVATLVALGDFEGAMKYLTEEWHSIRRKAHKQLTMQIQLNVLAEKKDKEQYLALYAKAPMLVKNSPVFQVQRLIVEEKYKEAIDMMRNKFNPNTPLQKIQQQYFLGKCYHALGELETAGIHFAYVTANGKDLMYRKKALELAGEKITEENE